MKAVLPLLVRLSRPSNKGIYYHLIFICLSLWFRHFASNWQKGNKFVLFLSKTYYSSGSEFYSSEEDNNTNDEHENSDMEVESVEM